MAYADRAGVPLHADFFLPDSPSNGPLVIFCHGGGWISGDRTVYQEEAEWLASLGIAAASADYRLAPLNTFPACIADLQDFVIYVRAHAERFGVDPNRIVSMGNSAGGHLSAMLALCDTYFGTDPNPGNFKVNGAVAVCPITDLTAPREGHYPISWSFIEQFLGSIDAPQEVLRAASPICHVSSNDMPMILIHGDEDDIVPIDQSIRLHEALRAVGAPTELHVLEGEMHGFTMPAWLQIREISLRFFQQFLVEGAMP